MSIPLTFSGRVALIAGAGGGIGLNIAHDLLAAGLDVVLADRKPKPDDVLVASITWSIRLVCSGLIKTPHLRPSISTSGIEYLKLISNRLF